MLEAFAAAALKGGYHFCKMGKPVCGPYEVPRFRPLSEFIEWKSSCTSFLYADFRQGDTALSIGLMLNLM